MEAIPAFELFGQAHVTALILIVLALVLISRVPESDVATRTARTMALVLLLLVVLKPILYIGVYDQAWGRSLPLDLCRINEFLCIVMLWRRSYRIFEVAYFLALGSIAALLMPNLPVGAPDPRFLLFFISHGLSVLGVLYAIFGYGFRPTLRSVGTVLIFLGVYTLLIAVLNQSLDANYLFLREKPAGASILDFLGPWPFYVIALIGIAIVLCFLCYLPFAFKRTESVQPDDRLLN